MFDFFVSIALFIALETLMGSKGDKGEVAEELPFFRTVEKIPLGFLELWLFPTSKRCF